MEDRSGGLRFNMMGVPIRMPWGGILGVLVIAFLWIPAFDNGPGSGIPAAALFAVLLYAGILLHELAHAWAAKSFGFPVREITLWLLGGYTVYERRRARPISDVVISLAGPVTTLGLGVVCWFLAQAAGSGFAAAVLSALAWSNVFLAVVNLLPAAPLDGGGVVKAIIWKLTGKESTGTLAAAYAGLVVAAALALLALYSLTVGSGDLLLGTLILAGFVGFGAWQSLRTARVRRALESTTLRDLLRPVAAVPPDHPLAAVLPMLGTSITAVVAVDAAGTAQAVLSPQAVAAVPAEQIPGLSVAPFTIPLDPDDRIRADGTLVEAVERMAAGGESALVAVDAAGRPVGVLLAADVNRLLKS